METKPIGSYVEYHNRARDLRFKPHNRHAVSLSKTLPKVLVKQLSVSTELKNNNWDII